MKKKIDLKSYTETDLKNIVNKFKNGMTKGPFLERMKNNAWTIDNDVYYDAVYQGYLDASRRFTGVTKINARFDVLRKIADEIKAKGELWGGDEETWHQKTCTLFIELFRKEGFDVTYGLAQKVINMAFKYLYCCAATDEEKKLYVNCHMPLDSYILDWYFGLHDLKPNVVWSKLNREQYLKIHANIMFALKGSKFTQLENEFIIWEEMTK